MTIIKTVEPNSCFCLKAQSDVFRSFSGVEKIMLIRHLNYKFRLRFELSWKLRGSANDFKAWKLLFVHILDPKMNAFDHCVSESRGAKNVDVPLATELIGVIIFSNYESQKDFRRKSFGEKIQNIPSWEKTKSILKNTNRIQREHEVLALYIKFYCLGTWQIFFRNPFSKSVSFFARVGPPLGAGEKFFWEARGLSSFSDDFKSLDPHLLYGFSSNFQFKMCWISCRFLKKKNLRTWIVSKFQDQKFSSKNPLGNA